MTKSVSKWRKIYEKIFCYALVFIISPCFFLFEMSIVRPIIAKIYNFGPTKYTFHTIFPIFLFINIVGNMIMSIQTDTSLKKSVKSGNYCEKCNMDRPEKAWHCSFCNVCILRRDHHCFFLSRCIGLKNLRYFILYLGYIFVSLIYSTYYNFYYIASKFDDDMCLSVLRIINPFLRYMISEPLGMRDLYVFFLFLNMGLVLWTGVLFSFHIRNVLYGVTARESEERRPMDWRTKKLNFIRVFGFKWYLAIVWPFADSPLPSSDIKSN